MLKVVNMVNNRGQSALFSAALRCYLVKADRLDAPKNRYPIIKTLIKYGANVLTIKPITLMTPLHWTAFNGDS